MQKSPGSLNFVSNSLASLHEVWARPEPAPVCIVVQVYGVDTHLAMNAHFRLVETCGQDLYMHINTYIQWWMHIPCAHAYIRTRGRAHAHTRYLTSALLLAIFDVSF